MRTKPDLRSFGSRSILAISATLYAVLLAFAPLPLPVSVILVSMALAGPLLWITVVDTQRWIIPDLAVLMAALGGILAISWLSVADLLPNVMGASLIGLSLLLLAVLGHRGLGRPVLGFGDVKLAAAGTLWIGIYGSLSALLIASVLGILASLTLRQRILPFGPFLAISIWGIWLYGPVDF